MRFPSLSEAQASRAENAVRSVLPTRPFTIELERLLAALERAEVQMRTVEVGMEPPPIFVSQQPAVLVQFLGPPRFEKVDGTGLARALNTNWDVLRHEESGAHYLRLDRSWLTAPGLWSGAWP